MYIKSLHPQPVFLIAGAKVRTKKRLQKKQSVAVEFRKEFVVKLYENPPFRKVHVRFS